MSHRIVSRMLMSRRTRWNHVRSLLGGLALLGMLAPRLLGADLTWDGTADGALPAGWTLHSVTDPATVQFQDGRLNFSCDPNHYCHLDHPLAGLDGSDEAPLRVEVAVAVDAAAAVDNAPALLGLYWGPQAVVTVGLGAGPGDRTTAAWNNAVVVMSVDGATTTLTPTDIGLYQGASVAHLRLVVTTAMVSVYASGDGWNWARLAGLTRAPSFSGPPAQVIVGRAWTSATHPKTELDNDPPQRPAAPGAPASLAGYHFSDFLLSNHPAEVPAALMKDYERKDSREETQDAAAAAGAVKQWQVAGPLDARAYPVESTPATAALPALPGAPWTTFTPGDSPTDRIVVLSEVLPGAGEHALRYAVATVTLTEPRLERFYFDGISDVTLYVNTHQLAFATHPNSALAIDRLSAVCSLHAGANRIVLKLSSGPGGKTLYTLRHDQGSLLYQIALDQRLAIDFAGDSEDNLNALIEISAAWEDLGYQAQAARAQEEVAKSPDASPEQIDHALIERTRLDRELGDEERVTADVDELSKRWAEGADSVTANLKAANMWERMGQGEKAAAALAAASAAAAHDPDRLIEIGLERLRLHQDASDPAGVASDLQALLAALPPGDPRRSQFQVQLALRRLRAGANPTALLREAALQGGLPSLRRIGAIQILQGDIPGRLATLERLAGLEPAGQTLDCPLIAHAELAAAAQPGSALQDYARLQAALALAARQAAANDPGADPVPALPPVPREALAAARAQAISGLLLATSDGRTLLRTLAQQAPPEIPSEPPVWAVVGPIDNPGFRCYQDDFLAKEGVDLAHVDTTKPVEKIPWTTVGRDAWPNGILDLFAMYHGNNCVALLSTEVTSPREFPTELSMGSDDGLKVWVNGVVVHSDETQRGISPDSIRAPVTFHAGVNHILAMVQQGGGQWDFQFRILGGSGGANLGDCLRQQLAQALPRPALASSLAGCIDQLVRSGSYAQAALLERILLCCYPDVPDVQFNSAWQMETQARTNGDGDLLMALEPFFESSALSIDPARDPWMRDQRWRLAELECGWARFSLAEETLADVQTSCYASYDQAETLRRYGELYRLTGFTHLATLAYTKAQGMGVADGNWQAQVAAGLQACRPGKAHVSSTSFEVDNQLRTAERAVAAGDLISAIGGFQKVLEENSLALATRSDGQLQSAGAYVAERLRALGADGIRAYRGRYESRAAAALATALATSDPTTAAERCETLAFTYPVTVSALSALTHAADCYLLQGAYALGGATCERCLAMADAQSPAYGALVARCAFAAAHANDAPAFARAQALAQALSSPVVLNGQPVATATWLAPLQALLHGSAAPEPAVEIGTATTLSSFPVPPDDAFDLVRVPWLNPLVMFAPTLQDDTLYLTALTGTRAIDLASGHVRWRDYPEFPALRFPQHWNGFLGSPQCQVALTPDLVVARALRGPSGTIEARDRSDGQLVWTTESTLPGASATSSPAVGEDRVFARFSANNTSLVIAFALGDGHVLWQTTTSQQRPFVPGLSDGDITVDGYLAPPTVLGREVVISTDLGTVLCLDAGTGAILWDTPYAHGHLDPVQGAAATALQALRAPPRVLAAGPDLLLAAPRDSMSLLALNRAGTLLWQRPLNTGRELGCISPDGSLAILGWLRLEAIATSDGRLRWAWTPHDGAQLTGTPLVVGDQVLACSQLGIARLELATGRELEYHTWKELGVANAVPGDLIMSARGLIGVGNGLVVRFGGPAPAAGSDPPLAGIERGTVLPAASWPAAPLGGPLAVMMRIGGDAVLQIDQPDGLSATQCFVRFAHSFALIDIPRHQVVWRVRLGADVRAIIYSAQLVIAVHHTGLTTYARADGTPHWTLDLSQGPVQAVRDSDSPPTLTLGANSLYASRPGVTNTFDAYSLSDGQHLASFTTDANGIAIMEYQNSVFLLLRGDNLYVEERTLDNLGTRHGLYNSGIPISDRDVGYALGPAMLLHSHTQAAWFDCAARTFKPFDLPLINCGLWHEQGKWAMLGYDQANQWWSAIWDEKGTMLFKEGTAGGACWVDHPNGDHLLRFDWDRGGFLGVVARSFATGKEAWYLKERQGGWSQRFNGMAMLERYALLFISNVEGDFTYQLVDTQNGTVAASGPLPGEPPPDIIQVAVAGSQVVYGTSQGLVVLTPTTVAASGAAASDPSVPSLGTLTPYAIYNAPASPMVIDGHLDDWTDIDAIELTAPDAARSGGGAALPQSGHARVQMCWDADGLKVAVRVVAPTHHDIIPGGSALFGDGLVLAIDPDADNFRAGAPVLLSLSLRDGISRLALNGVVMSDAPDQPRLRAAVDPQGITYELAIPWATLRADPNNRPGGQRSLHVALLSTTAVPGDLPRALELGWGLAGGFDKSLWQPCMLTTAAEGSVNGVAFSLFGGHATWGPAGVLRARDHKAHNWITDALPPGAGPAADGGDAWTWVAGNLPPGASKAHDSATAAGGHQHYFAGMAPEPLRAKDKVFAWVYLDPAHLPEEVVVQWNDNGSWEHRAAWGANRLPWGTWGTVSDYNMGPLPKAGAWVRLEVPVEWVGLR